MGKHLQTVAAMACMKSLLMVFNFVFWVSTNVRILWVINLSGNLLTGFRYNNTGNWYLDGSRTI